MRKLVHVFLTVTCLVLVTTEAKAVTISIDPLRTFLFTNNDPWTGIGSVQPSVPIALSTIGISAGDMIELDQLGDYYDGRDGYGAGVNTFALDTSTEMIGIFSSSATLLAPNLLDRVPDAIDAGLSVTSWNTLFGNMSTDIPYDFRVANTVVQVPFGATYLFIAAHDIYYSDNSDPDGDYAVTITRLSSSAPVPENSAMFGLGFIFVAVLHALCARKTRSA